MLSTLGHTGHVPAPSDLVVTLADVPRRVRVVFAGEVVADSERVRMLRETRYTPRYYFPWEDVRRDLLVASPRTEHAHGKGEASYWSLRVGDRVSEGAVWAFPQPVEDLPELAGLASFDWLRVDAVFEEDEQVYVHPRDPTTRIDIFDSSRHVEIKVGGLTLADSRRPRMLFESSLGLARFYLPPLDVRLDLLAASDTRTQCPYKGTASYWSASVGDEVLTDLVWGYPTPLAESARIAGRLCFFDEFVDTFVDGVLRPRPETKWKYAGPDAYTWTPVEE